MLGAGEFAGRAAASMAAGAGGCTAGAASGGGEAMVDMLGVPSPAMGALEVAAGAVVGGSAACPSVWPAEGWGAAAWPCESVPEGCPPIPAIWLIAPPKIEGSALNAPMGACKLAGVTPDMKPLANPDRPPPAARFARRASLKAMAMACFCDRTTGPRWLPECRFPAFHLCISVLTTSLGDIPAIGISRDPPNPDHSTISTPLPITTQQICLRSPNCEDHALNRTPTP